MIYVHILSLYFKKTEAFLTRYLIFKILTNRSEKRSDSAKETHTFIQTSKIYIITQIILQIHYSLKCITSTAIGYLTMIYVQLFKY